MKKDGYIEIEYRIAVLLNESGLIRNAYSNIIPNLSSIMKSEEIVSERFKKKYSFIPFTRNNILELFSSDNINYLLSFDALFICTNATNDTVVGKILERNSNILELFIKNKKGFFLGSQKNLSENSNGGDIKFLPELLNFHYQKRKEEKSSEGCISFFSKQDSLLKDCSEDDLNYKCHHNRFKDHVYRSYLEIRHPDQFVDILIDKKYKNRKLLVKSKQNRVIYSSVCIDYEEHNLLLRNIIQFLTEGTPTIAFFGKKLDKSISFNNKFDILLINAKLNKLPIAIYNQLIISEEVLKYEILVVSPEYTEEATKQFWNKFLDITNHVKKTKLIYINSGNNNENIITQYKNYSDIDIKLREVPYWIQNSLNKSGGKWCFNLWQTYDMMTFFNCLSQSHAHLYKNFIDSLMVPFLTKIKTHYRDVKSEEKGSYDGMLNCSCALLELFAIFGLEKISKYKTFDFDLTLNYIIDYIENDNYLIDSEIVLITLYNLRKFKIKRIMDLFKMGSGTSSFINSLLFQVVTSIIDKYNIVLNSSSKHVDKIESLVSKDMQIICKEIEILSIALQNENSIFDTDTIKKIEQIFFYLLLYIENNQVNGYWVNTIRTASILKVLIKIAYDYRMIDTSNAALGSILSQVIMSAINFIFNELYKNQGETGIWLCDLEATMSISYALCLFNNNNRNNIKEFESFINNGEKETTAIKILDEYARELTQMRETLSEKETIIDELKDNLIPLEKEKYIHKQNRIRLAIFLLFFIIISLSEAIVIFKNYNLIDKWKEWLLSLPIEVSLLTISIFVHKIFAEKLFPSDDDLFNVKEKKVFSKKNKSNKKNTKGSIIK